MHVYSVPIVHSIYFWICFKIFTWKSTFKIKVWNVPIASCSQLTTPCYIYEKLSLETPDVYGRYSFLRNIFLGLYIISIIQLPRTLSSSKNKNNPPQKKFLIFRKMQLFSPPGRKFLMLQEMKTTTKFLKLFLYFASFYISGNGKPKTLLIFQGGTFQGQKSKIFDTFPYKILFYNYNRVFFSHSIIFFFDTRRGFFFIYFKIFATFTTILSLFFFFFFFFLKRFWYLGRDFFWSLFLFSW